MNCIPIAYGDATITLLSPEERHLLVVYRALSDGDQGAVMDEALIRCGWPHLLHIN